MSVVNDELGNTTNIGLPEGKKYGAILADPPWLFTTYSRKNQTRGTERHYKTAATADLADIPVASIAADNCALFLWVVDSHLDGGIELMEAWGFKFKTVALVWVKVAKTDITKPRMGMGYWTRKECEVCVLGTRGSPRRLSGGVRQVIIAPRREHSRKPDEAYRRVESLVTGPYIELFGRQRVRGWDTWGNESDKFAFDSLPAPPPSTLRRGT